MRFSPDMEVATTDQILPMVRSNLGIGFCPEGIARPAVERGEVYEILLEEEIPERQITLVEDSGKPQSIAVQKLLTYFK
jgi:DNA-binding transcriptional LysR family regulator